MSNLNNVYAPYSMQNLAGHPVISSSCESCFFFLRCCCCFPLSDNNNRFISLYGHSCEPYIILRRTRRKRGNFCAAMLLLQSAISLNTTRISALEKREIVEKSETISHSFLTTTLEENGSTQKSLKGSFYVIFIFYIWTQQLKYFYTSRLADRQIEHKSMNQNST